MNKKVTAMFEKAEDEYNALMTKKNIIEVSFGGSVQHSLKSLKHIYELCFFFFHFLRLTNQKSRKLLRSLMRRKKKH